MDNTFCKSKLDGYYQDPKDCAAFYHCTRGSAFRKHCLRGQVFNDILKACDNPMNFPCQQRNLISVFIPIKEKAAKQAAYTTTQHDLPETSPNILPKGMLLLSCTVLFNLTSTHPPPPSQTHIFSSIAANLALQTGLVKIQMNSKRSTYMYNAIYTLQLLILPYDLFH